MPRAKANPRLDPIPERILVAAEALFSRRGLDGVSLREIATAAGNGNNNAVQYHFASKDGLVTAIHRHRVAQMDEHRAAMLNAAREAGQEHDLRALIEIVCLPQLAFRDDGGRHTFAHFHVQYLTTHHSRGLLHPLDVDNEWPTALRDVYVLMYDQMAGLSHEVRRERIVLSNMIFLCGIVRWDNRSDRAEGMPDELMDDLLKAATAVLAAP